MARPKKDNADYFPHDASMRDDSRVKALRKKFGQLEGYALYCMLIEYLSHKNYFTVKLTDVEYEVIAGDFGVDVERLKEFINYSSGVMDLFQLIDGNLSCRTLNNRMEFLITKRKRDNTRQKFKDKIFERDGFRCLKCGSEHNLVLDHIIPVTKGGPDEIDNLQTLCKDCNSAKGVQIADYRRENPQSKEKESKEKESKEEKPARPVAFANPFMEGSAVSKAWSEWEQYRKEKKQKLTPSTVKKQIQFLGGRGDPEIIAIINQSITNGWTGLFEIKNKENGFRARNQRKADAVITGGNDFGKL